MTYSISDLTLDEVIAALIGGETLQDSVGGTFALSSGDSRAILSFYNQDRRTYWDPERNAAIQDGEIDKVLAALDKPLNVTPVPVRRAAAERKWQLIKVEAHRFRGLHRHCDDAGADPRPFELELMADATLFRGFNGAGKTSLISAICWCLTGMGHRSQGLPSSLEDAVKVRLADDEGAEASTPAEFELPVIVPIPTEDELVLVDGAPKLDTWVKLTFRSLTDGREVVVERHLQREGRKGFKSQPVNLEQLGLSNLALQVGTLMPGIAAATRFDDKTTLSQAVSTLTGLRPLAHFGTRCVRLHDRLTDKYPKQAGQDQAAALRRAGQQKETLTDLLKEGEGLPSLDCVVLPAEANPTSWEHGVEAAERELKSVEDRAASDAMLILGSLPALTNEAEIRRFAEALKAADQAFSGSALQSLPSLRLAARMGKLSPEDLLQAEQALDGLEAEGRTLAAELAHAGRNSRRRLYGLVARWHEETHPGEPLDACPVCRQDLNGIDVPTDALLDQSVAEALQAARSAKAAMLKTAAEWERDAKLSVRSLMPASIQPLLDEKIPDDLAALYENGLAREVFSQPDFPASLKTMAVSVTALCKAAAKDAPPRPPLPGVDLPAEIPDNERLRDTIKTARRIILLARYRQQHAAFAQKAVNSVIKAGEEPLDAPVNQQPVTEQLKTLGRYLDAARVFAGIRRQLSQFKETCDAWKSQRARIERLARAAEAVEPFTKFPDLVHDQVAGLISSLDEKASAWAARMYRAHFAQAPSYAGLDRQKGDGFTFLAAQGKHLVEAHHVMNASALRAYLSAFVLALWEQVWARSGGLSTILMDDPQDLLDPGNVANLAATVPYLLAAGMKPIVVSNDFAFIPAVEGFVASNSIASQYGTEVLEFSAISRSKCTVSLAPVVDQVRARCEAWRTINANDVDLARAFVYPVRVRVEVKLWDLLASDPSPLKDPTLGELLGRISNARNRGERPFDEEPFRRLLDLEELRPGAAFRDAINKAHHGKADQITPADAEVVMAGYPSVFSAIDACWLSYARFMGRLTPDQAVAHIGETPEEPPVVALSRGPLSVVGRLAAREPGAPLTTLEDAVDRFDLASLGDVSLFTLRAPTLGMVAFPGQTLVVAVGAPVRNGDLAVVATKGRTYARRVGIDPADPARIALETIPSINPNAPPTHFVPRYGATLSKVVGVLFDEVNPVRSSHEVVPLAASPVLDEVLAAAVVGGDSAFPIARNNGYVLLGRAPDLSSLGGRIIAVVTREDQFSGEHFAYLKRLGRQLPGPGSIYYLENVGQSGEGEFVQFPSAEPPMPGVAVVQDTWKVLGSIFG